MMIEYKTLQWNIELISQQCQEFPHHDFLYYIQQVSSSPLPPPPPPPPILNKRLLPFQSVYPSTAIQTQLLQPTDEDRVTVIDTVNFNDSLFFPQQLSIQIPAELIQMFTSTNTSGSAVNGVRAISTVYQNINNLFPQSRPEKNE